MEKQTKIKVSKNNPISKDNIKTRPDLNVFKIKEHFNSLDKAAKEIIIPLLKIQKKLSLKFEVFARNYNEIIKKAKTANSEIIKHLEESKNDSMNITDIQLNQKYANEHENMIKFYQYVSEDLELFINLFKSNEYNNLIKEFDKLIPEGENFTFEDIEILEKIEKENIIYKKPTKKSKRRSENSSKKTLKKLGENKEKKEYSEVSVSRKKKQAQDLLDMLQKEFPSNNYVQKISRTFIKRRLFKKVIYRHIFNYKGNNKIEENKLRSSGESTIYKFGKFLFKFKNDELFGDNANKLQNYFKEELKQCFIKVDKDNKAFIIAGKIGGSLNIFLEKYIRKDLYTQFNILQCTVEFYEFYEELVSEFDEKEENVRILLCDKKIMDHLKEDWESLKLVRDFVTKKKKEGISQTNNKK